MVGRRHLWTGCLAAVLASGAMMLHADAPSFQLSGTLYTWDGGLTQTPTADYDDGIQNWEAAGFSWDVSFNAGTDRVQGDDWVTYTYSFDIDALAQASGNDDLLLPTGDGNQWRDLSHFVIELSEDLGLDGNTLREFSYHDGSEWVGYPNALEISGPDEDGHTWLKFDETADLNEEGSGLWQVQFESTRLPMWGNLFLKDGQVDDPDNSGNVALTAANGDYVYPHFDYYNRVFDVVSFESHFQGFSPDSGNLSTYVYHDDTTEAYLYGILVPDTMNSNLQMVPEPTSALLGLLLACTGLAVRRHRRSATETC